VTRFAGRVGKAGLCLLLSVLAACGGARTAADPALMEVQRIRSGEIDVVVLAPTDALKQTRNYCTVEFRSAADQHLLDVGTVKVHTSMTMEGAPMEGFVTEPVRIATGRYTIEMVLAKTGDWTIAVDWAGAAGTGSVSFPAAVK
jgi:hypothetical protein